VAIAAGEGVFLLDGSVCVVVEIRSSGEVLVLLPGGRSWLLPADNVEGALVVGGVYELQIDDELALLDASDGCGTVDVEIFVKGKASTGPEVELAYPDGRRTIDVGQLAGDDELEFPDLQRAQGKLRWRSIADGDHRTGWLVDGDGRPYARLEEWLTQQRLTDMRGRPTKRVFVNPYTFVPFPADGSCQLRLPAGHQGLSDGRYMGRLSITWTAETPLLVRGGEQDGVLRFPRRVDGTPVVPGSSIKGAVRSLHETLFGGCLRVFDEQYLPVYRAIADQRARGKGWKLGQVAEVDPSSGRPVTITICDQVVWVRHDAFSDAGFDDLRTGSTCDVDESAITDSSPGRREARAVTEGAGWVVLITDAGARSGAPYYAATGRLTDTELKVTDLAWDRYRLAVDGADDLRTGATQSEDGFAEVDYAQKGQAPMRIGRRRRASRRLAEHDVLWVRVEDGLITELALAYFWRTPGDIPAGGRVPADLKPCTDPENLCVSCRLFGSADVGGADRSAGNRQRAYRGHVRFGDARTERHGDSWPVEHLAPLAAPRPGAGQLYLDLRSQAAPSDKGQVPARQWGHPGRDKGADPRQLRGRKFYWHAAPGGQQPWRGHERDHHSGALTTSAELAPAGTRFTGSVWFENLSLAELAGLVAAIDPHRLLNASAPPGYHDTGPEIRPHLGGGKPFGLGTVDPSVELVEVADGPSRYGEGAPVAIDMSDIDTAIGGLASDVPDGVRQRWPDLAAALNVHHVNPARVWYPPAQDWSHAGEPGFDATFEFFKHTSGQWLSEGGRPMVPLPDPHEADQYLDIKKPGGGR
jgi:CRISPR-associated protein (TIGR03986 family)